MLNVYELEKRWQNYKLKYLLPRIIFSSLALLFLSIMIVLYIFSEDEEINSIQSTKDNNISPKQNMSSISNKNAPAISTNIEVDQNTYKSHKVKKDNSLEKKQMEFQENKKNKKILLQPSVEFMKTMNKDVVPYYTQNNDNTTVTSKEYQEETSVITNNVQTSTLEVQKEDKESSINIKKGTTQNDIEHVLQRFKKNNNPALSLFVAKKYYDLGDYHNAYNYALITNEISNDIEESWIIFAKSLVKLGQKQKAINTLKQYLQYSQSSKANLLLDNILSGKFQ